MNSAMMMMMMMMIYIFALTCFDGQHKQCLCGILEAKCILIGCRIDAASRKKRTRAKERVRKKRYSIGGHEDFSDREMKRIERENVNVCVNG
jgi:hypothetical protein